MSKIDDSLFGHGSAHHAAYGDCPKCGAPLAVKHKGKSSFLGCTAYPECDFIESLNKDSVTLVKVIEGSECPDCSSALAVKNGRYGMFIGCTNFPDCHYISSKKTAQAAKQDETVINCPVCNEGKLIKKPNKFGKFFFACDNYPKCRFILNETPVAKTCNRCGFAVAIKKVGTDELKCANRHCS